MSIPVRIPDSLHARIEERAQRERRSVANMTAVLLEFAFASEELGVARIETTDGEIVGVAGPPTTANSPAGVPRAEVEADEHFRPDFGSKLGKP